MTPSKRVAALFLVALLGVLAALTTLVGEALGGWAAAAFAALWVVGLGVASARVHAARRPPVRDHSACACCAGSPAGIEVR